MRVIMAMSASMLLLVGCTVSPPNASPTPAGSWRVVPLNPPNTPAILVNEQTGDTWMYNGATEWNPMKRN